MKLSKPASSAVRLVVMLAVLGAAALALAADGGKPVPNVDPAKRGSSPRTEAVAQAALADQVARHADRTKDVLAMIAAARMLGQVGPRAVKHEMRTEGKPKAVDAKASGDLSRDTGLSALLARARQYAGGRNDLNGLVDELAKSTAKARNDGPARFATRIADGVTDVYTLNFAANEPVMVAITGEGTSDLDLSIEDEAGNRICASDGAGDDEICRWTPRRTGNFRIRVRNIGVANEYRLWSN
ncbi:MAG: PPC domain-containing protein [Burkholderiales bacterium]|nr:PPC domain-containing protein [Burkholderiales bacterium]